MRRLSEVVSVERRFRRSMRVDFDQDAGASEGFICTPTAAQALRTMAKHVSGHGHGAFTWTGSYGCGKSSLAVVLAAALGRNGEARRRALAVLPDDVRAALDEGFAWARPGWTVVALTGRRADAGEVIGTALDDAGLPGSGRDPVERLAAAAAKAPAGVLLIVDEMGKLLEHAATGEGDAFLFQSLAEAASRSEGRLVVVGILHQAFDDYAYRLARETREDWLKVQGRFVDIPLGLAGEEQLGLLSAAISAPDVDEALPLATITARAIRGEHPGAAPLADVLAGCWPINPVVAALLGPLSRRRFGQNQRSLFGFLSSAEPAGFQDFLTSTDEGTGSLYDPDWLWRYLRYNLEPSILASPDSHRWSLALEALERCEARGADETRLRVARAVALVDMFRERSGLVASVDVLRAALPDLDGSAIEKALASLQTWSVVIHRRHLGGFSLFAGSDFDVEGALREALAGSAKCDYARLRGTGVFGPVLAKRHYHETGAMRWFEVDIAPLEDAGERIARFRGDAGAVGLFLLLLNEDGASREKVSRRLVALAEQIGERPIALGVASDSYMLRELSLELLALEGMLTSRAELKGDAVARREVASRAARAGAELEERLRGSLASTSWRVPGLELEAGGTADSGGTRLSRLASTLAERIFPQSPTVANELLNRSRPSSNAAAAMKALMVAMVTSADLPRLGITGSPPEGGLYTSVVAHGDLHGPDGERGWSFRRPDQQTDRCRLLPMWDAADRILDEAGADGLTLDALHGLWAGRPFGAKQGLLPVLSLAYMLAEQRELSFYLDGTFCPEIGDFLVDRMLQEPGAVRVRRTRIDDDHAAILRGVANVAARLLGENPTETPEPLSVGRQLVAVVKQAPPWTRRTGTLPARAAQVRNLAASADDPTKFMLDDLPRLFDLEGDDLTPARLVGELEAGLQEIVAAYPDMLRTLLRSTLAALGEAEGTASERLVARAGDVVGLSGNFRLDAFANRLKLYDGSIEAMEGLASLAANKPPRDWVDRDVDQARLELAALAQDFLRAEAFGHVKGRATRRIRMGLYVSDPSGPGVTTSEFDLDDVSRRRAQKIAERLLGDIGDLPREVALAAVLELGARLAREADLADGDAAAPRRANA